MPRVKLSEFLDKLALLCAMLLFAWVGIRAIVEVRRLDSIAGQGRPMLSELKVNAPRYEAEPPTAEERIWSAPESQSRGDEWVFDVFTPPVIYYDPNSREFAVTPPSLQVAENDESQWAVFSLDLIEIRLRPYKLQLVGYAGEPGSFVAYFENVDTGELILLRENQEAPELGVRLLAFQEQEIEIENEEDTPIVQNVGVAKLMDFQTGQEVSLTNLETKMFSDLEAQVRVRDTGRTHVVQVGSRLELENGDYVIEDLSAEPQEAMVSKISKDGSRRFSKTLTPISTPQSNPRGSLQEEAVESPFAIRPNRNPR